MAARSNSATALKWYHHFTCVCKQENVSWEGSASGPTGWHLDIHVDNSLELRQKKYPVRPATTFSFATNHPHARQFFLLRRKRSKKKKNQSGFFLCPSIFKGDGIMQEDKEYYPLTILRITNSINSCFYFFSFFSLFLCCIFLSRLDNNIDSLWMYSARKNKILRNFCARSWWNVWLCGDIYTEI